MQFIAEHQLQEESMAELSRKYGISRKTAYKWLSSLAAGRPRRSGRPQPRP
jgi:transposase-like protein